MNITTLTCALFSPVSVSDSWFIGLGPLFMFSGRLQPVPQILWFKILFLIKEQKKVEKKNVKRDAFRSLD